MWREDPNSRQNTIKTVIERANSKENWSQVTIVVLNVQLLCKQKSLYNTFIAFADNNFPRGNVYESIMFAIVQTRCILSRCSGATSLYQVSKCTRYRYMDMGRTRSVCLICICVCITYNEMSFIHGNSLERFNRLKLLWLTLCQFNTNCEVEFLPVYTPNDEEKNNPKLFATNVRNVMAK